MKRLELLEERLLVSALYIFKEMALIRSYEFVPEMANTVLDKPNLTIERANGGIYYGFVGQPETLIEFNSVSLSAMLYSIENGDETFFVFEGLKAMPLYELKEHIEFIEGYGETEALCTLFSVEDFIQRLKYRISDYSVVKLKKNIEYAPEPDYYEDFYDDDLEDGHYKDDVFEYDADGEIVGPA